MSMEEGYGSHPTQYANMKDLDLYAEFRHDNWVQHDENTRRELLQEVVNRSAVAHGELGSCKVEFAQLEPQLAGSQQDGTITLNREMFVNDRQIATYNGQTIARPMQDANMQALTTVLHENEHAYQNQVIEGTICVADQHAAEYRANNFDDVLIQDDKGDYQRGITYLTGGSKDPLSYYLYYIQPTERDAHRISEAKAQEIMNQLEAVYGTEASFEAFRADLEANGYEATLSTAQQLTGEPDIEHQVNQALMNQYYGTNAPVSPGIEAEVKNEMVSSYNDLMGVQRQQQSQSMGQELGEGGPNAGYAKPDTTLDQGRLDQEGGLGNDENLAQASQTDEELSQWWGLGMY